MTIDELLLTPYRVIDILPERVPENSPGQYSAVERYFLKDKALRRRQAELLLKLNCYYDLTFVLPRPDGTEEEIFNPAPETVTKLVGREYLCVLIGGEVPGVPEALITADRADAYMTVYHAEGRLLDLIHKLTEAAGLFLWEEEREEDR